MLVSYKKLKEYVPDLPPREKIWDIFTYHLCEVESVEDLPNGDTIFDINILPNRAHDLLSHQGVARELASLLNLKYQNPEVLHKVPESTPTNLKVKIETDKCRRYMARIVRNVKIKDSPGWIKNHLESIGQRSINNVIDATNIVMYDSGQPTHCFDLDKISGGIVVRQAKEFEQIELLGGEIINNLKKERSLILNPSNMVIADNEGNVLALAGVKGGKFAEVDKNTKNILIEVANFDPVSVRRTKGKFSLFTDSAKRFENDLSAELCDFAMREISSLLMDLVVDPERPEGAGWEDIVDEYKEKQTEKKLSFRLSKISKILGLELKQEEVEDILHRYHFIYKIEGDVFEIKVPYFRLDLNIEEDIAEEIGRVIGYQKIVPKLPKIDFTPKINKTYQKILFARKKMLLSGYSEVLTYTFCNKGTVEVLASASDKKFLRTNISDGLKESIKMNVLNLPLLNTKEVKVFEIGNIFLKDREELRIAFGDKKKIEEMTLDDFIKKKNDFDLNFDNQINISKDNKFVAWSMYPFIVRDIALWVPENTEIKKVEKIIKENTNELVVKGPTLFDEFKKDNRISYAFRLVFQSYERTLTDEEVNKIMKVIVDKLKENKDWEIR